MYPHTAPYSWPPGRSLSAALIRSHPWPFRDTVGNDDRPGLPRMGVDFFSFPKDTIYPLTATLASLVNPDNMLLTKDFLIKAYKDRFNKIKACVVEDENDEDGEDYFPQTLGEKVCFDGIKKLLIFALEHLQGDGDFKQKLIKDKTLTDMYNYLTQQKKKISDITNFDFNVAKDVINKLRYDLTYDDTVQGPIPKKRLRRMVRFLARYTHEDKTKHLPDDQRAEAMSIFKDVSSCIHDMQGGGQSSFKDKIVGLGLCILAAIVSLI
jgi:hypothetical protein